MGSSHLDEDSIHSSFDNIVKNLTKNATDDHAHSGGHHGELNSEAMAVLFIFLTLCCAGLVKEVNKKTGVNLNFLIVFNKKKLLFLSFFLLLTLFSNFLDSLYADAFYDWNDFRKVFA